MSLQKAYLFLVLLTFLTHFLLFYLFKSWCLVRFFFWSLRLIRSSLSNYWWWVNRFMLVLTLLFKNNTIQVWCYSPRLNVFTHLLVNIAFIEIRFNISIIMKNYLVIVLRVASVKPIIIKTLNWKRSILILIMISQTTIQSKASSIYLIIKHVWIEFKSIVFLKSIFI